MPTSGVQTFTLTVDEIIKLAMLDIGALAIGESPTQEEYADAIHRLNMLISTFSNFVNITKRGVASVELQNGINTYTLSQGTQRLLHAWLTSPDGDSAIDVLDYKSYDACAGDSLTGAPRYLRVNYNVYPPTVNVYPTPDATSTLNYSRLSRFDSVTSITEEVDFPQHALAMIVKGLASYLANSHRLALEERMLFQREYEQAKIEYMSNNTERHGGEIVSPKGVLIV